MAVKASHMLCLLLILESGSCSQPEKPSVEPANATHLLVSWKDFWNKNSEYLESYAIILDEKELPKQDNREQYSAYVKADPCLKHDIAMKVEFDSHPDYREKIIPTKTAHYMILTTLTFSTLVCSKKESRTCARKTMLCI